MPTPPTDGNIDPYGLPAYASDYRSSAAYDVETGTLILPTCDGGGPVVIQVFDPYRTKRVVYSGKSIGRPPVMPRPADTDVTIAHSHTLKLPGLTLAGLGGFVYDCSGGFVVLDLMADGSGTGLADAYSEAEYECPRYPAKFPGLAAEMESQGFKYLPRVDQPDRQEVNLTDPNYQWPQALTVTSDFFSEQLV